MRPRKRVVLRESAEALGRRGFILRYGILGVGVPTAVGGAILMHGYQSGFTWSGFFSFGFLALLLFYLVTVAPLLGYIWGHMFWKMAEKRNDPPASS